MKPEQTTRPVFSRGVAIVLYTTGLREVSASWCSKSDSSIPNGARVEHRL